MLSDIFEEAVIHKVIVVATDEDATMRAVVELRSIDVDATMVLEEHLKDDRAIYARKLRQFGSGVYKALCLPYDVWRSLQHDLQFYVGNTNLLVLYETGAEYARICIDWIKDLHLRGFAMADNFLIHLVERDYDQG